MKITMERDAFAPALDLAAACAQKRAVIPICGCIRLTAQDREVRIAANNLDSSIEVIVPADVIHAGDVAVPAETLRDIVRNSPRGAQVAIETDGARTIVRTSRSRYALATLPVADWPQGRQIEAGDRAVRIEMAPEDVPLLLKRPAPYVEDIKKRAFLAGIWLNERDGRLWAFGTNGWQLLATSISMPEDGFEGGRLAFANGGTEVEGVVIPVQIADELARALERGGALITNGRTVVAEAANLRYSGGLLVNQFPPAWRAVPEIAENRLTVDRDEMMAALKRLAAVDTENAHLVIEAEAGAEMLTLRLTRSSEGEGEEQIRIDGTAGGTLSAAFVLPVIAKMIAGLAGEKVSLSRSPKASGCFVRVEDGDDATVLAAIGGVSNTKSDAKAAEAQASGEVAHA